MQGKNLIPYLFVIACLFCLFAPGNSHAQPPAASRFIKIPRGTIALTDAEIVDGTVGPVKYHQSLLIENGRIVAISGNSNFTAPPGATIINCSGKTIIPGMIMMHEHLFYGEGTDGFYLGNEMPISFPRLYLAGGVTTMRTTGSVEPQTDLNIKKWIEEGKMAGPEMDVSGPYIEREGLLIPEVSFLSSPGEAAKTVTYWAGKGCTSFKVYMHITRADMKEAIEAAHLHKMKVTGHLCSISFREAADLGIDNLEHGFCVSSDFDTSRKENQCSPTQFSSIFHLDENNQAMKDLMAYLIKKKVAITSTLPVFEPYSGREVFPGGAEYSVAPQIREAVEKRYQSALGKDSISIALFKKEMFWEKQFADMGGLLMAGIDPTGAGRVIPGYADRHVPELLVEAGFTLPEAIKISSLNAARYLGIDNETGTVAVGKKADLVLINGDIEKDMLNMRKTEIVFKNGTGFDSQKLFDSVKGLVGLY
jgi:imidazolonepropionase-like amidohydrolase